MNAEFSDDDFRDAGAEILSDAAAVMSKASAGALHQRHLRAWLETALPGETGRPTRSSCKFPGTVWISGTQISHRQRESAATSPGHLSNANCERGPLANVKRMLMNSQGHQKDPQINGILVPFGTQVARITP